MKDVILFQEERRCVVFAKRRIKWIRRKRIIGSKRPRNNRRLCSTFPHAKTPQRITEENWKLATRRTFSTELGQWPINSPLCLPGKRIGFATKVFFFFHSPNWIRETLSFQWVANLDSVKAGERQWLRFCHSEDEKKASTSLVKSEWKDSAYQEIHLNLLACELELIRFYFTLTHRHTFLRKRKKESWERERRNSILRRFSWSWKRSPFLASVKWWEWGKEREPKLTDRKIEFSDRRKK